jgi:hypothetical protein
MRKKNVKIDTKKEELCEDFAFFYKDSKKRIVLKIIGDQVMVARFKDMSKKTRKIVIEICKKMSNFDIKKLKDFLDYKTKEDEFCS